ncbi:hypothetical protein V2H45_00895 [Tumidithrix elongata RA019]|uniref:Uncharacterized protein n=1 Tax=Tumidithrix elongata BACA0141 TaxID=2716417 RepID=A0AAW9PXI8_9CYAN|nr:hypothetical protein [Tumidithrix elongata RA019]
MSVLHKNKEIYNCAFILLVHLILQASERRTTHPWGLAIFNSLAQIQKINQESQATGDELSKEQLMGILESAYETALVNAVVEAWGGIYKPEQLGSMVDRDEIIREAIAMIIAE